MKYLLAIIPLIAVIGIAHAHNEDEWRTLYNYTCGGNGTQHSSCETHPNSLDLCIDHIHQFEHHANKTSLDYWDLVERFNEQYDELNQCEDDLEATPSGQAVLSLRASLEESQKENKQKAADLIAMKSLLKTMHQQYNSLQGEHKLLQKEYTKLQVKFNSFSCEG